MSRPTLRRSAAALLVAAPLLTLVAGCGGGRSEAPAPTPAPSEAAASEEELLPDLVQTADQLAVLRPWTGDFDGMVERRTIRLLVSPSKTHYFVDRGTQRGLTYELGRIYEDDLNQRLKKKHLKVNVVFVPVARNELIPALLAGRGDVAAANLTITPERQAQVDFTNPTISGVDEIVVTGPASPPVAKPEDLSGQEVYIRRSSSYYDSVQALNAKLAAAGRPPATIREAPEVLSDEDILEMVNAGLVPMTVLDNHLAEFWAQVFDQIALHPEVKLRSGGQIAMMIRKGSPQLRSELDGFLARHPEGSKERNVLLQRYLKSTKFVHGATSPEERRKLDALRALFEKYGDQYGLDYVLIIAQGYQESRLDQNAKSQVGAIGIMQVMPATGKELGVGDIRQVEPNIHAGVKYIRFMIDKYYADEPMTKLDKGLFAFASYNAGPNRIRQLRERAAKRGLDPNVWFNNVEVVAAEAIGRETVQYVSNIYKYYLAYKLVLEQRAQIDAEKAKAAANPRP